MIDAIGPCELAFLQVFLPHWAALVADSFPDDDIFDPAEWLADV